MRTLALEENQVNFEADLPFPTVEKGVPNFSLVLNDGFPGLDCGVRGVKIQI